MATFTSKGLIKPDDGDNQDVAVLNTNSDRLNGYSMGPVVCTSLTRPTGSNRWDGMLIWETDTKLLRTWDETAGAWKALTPLLAKVVTVTSVADGSFSGTFPAGFFTVAPFVLCSVQTITQAAFASAQATSVTAFNGYCAYKVGADVATSSGFIVAVLGIQLF